MHRLPPWIWLLLAGVFGITASLAWVKSQSRQVPSVEKSVMALVAKKDIPQATRLSADQVQLSPWSQANLPKGAFTSLGEISRSWQKYHRGAPDETTLSSSANSLSPDLVQQRLGQQDSLFNQYFLK